MHKRVTKVLLSENAPAQTVNTKPECGPDKKSQPTVTGSGRFWRTVLPKCWCDVVMYAAVAFFLLVSAVTVASDRLEYSSDNRMGVHAGSHHTAAQSESFRGVRSETRDFASKRKVAPESTMMKRSVRAVPKVEDLGEMVISDEVNNVPSHAFKPSSSGRDQQTMGKMVAEALEYQEQEQSHEVTKSRMIIREGKISGKVPGSALESTAQQIESLVEDPSYGEEGYIANKHSSTENEYYPSSWRGNGNIKLKVHRIINLNLRIPSAYFQSAAERIKQIIEETTPDANEDPEHKGKINLISTTGRDVTDKFVDATARADTLDASRKAIQVLLSQADSIDDVMKIQKELNSLTQQSESVRRRALELKNMSTLSTLEIRLEEWKEVDTVDDNGDSDNDDDGKHGWSPLDSAYLALSHVSLLLMFAFDTLAYSLVWTVPCVTIYFVGMRVVFKLSKDGKVRCTF